MTRTRIYTFLSLVLIIITLSIRHIYLTDSVFRTNPLLYTRQSIRNFFRGKAYYHFRNICIDKNINPDIHREFYPFQAKLQAFDDSAKATKSPYQFIINLVKGATDSWWQVDVRPSERLPANRTVVDSVVLFPSYWRDSNQVFLFWSSTLPKVKDMLDWSRDHVTRDLKVTLFAPRIKGQGQTFRDVIRSIGISNVTDFTQTYDNSPVCFRHGVFRVPYKLDRTIGYETQKMVLKAWERTFKPCNETYMLIIQRLTTRRLLNIDHMTKIAHDYGYSKVRVESFEGKQLRDQYGIIRCASVFVAVQGAVLSWFSFLPEGATVVEMIYDGWPMRYQRRVLEERPDLNPQVIHCNIQTPLHIWEHYAKKWYNHTGVIDSELKKRLARDSDKQFPIGKSVWKDSDCMCPGDVFLPALPVQKISNA